MKDIDGARTVEFEEKEGSVFMWGRGFSYEFDRALFLHQISRMFGLVERQKALPEGSALCFSPCDRAALV